MIMKCKIVDESVNNSIISVDNILAVSSSL